MNAIEKIEPQAALPSHVGPVTPLDMLMRALDSGASMDVLEKFMALHERWEAANARKAFDAAISSAKAEIPTIKKNRRVGFESRRTGDRTDYAFADLAEIQRVINPILSTYGLSYRYRTRQDGALVIVTCIMSHRDGHSEETSLSGPLDTSGNKNPIQQIGSTVTFLERYTLTAALGLASSEDDDGKAAGAGDAISDEQVERLQREIMEADADLPAFLKYFKIEKLSDLPASKFDAAMQALARKRRPANG